MPKIHPACTETFRGEAVNPLLSSGRPLKRLVVDLRIAPNALRT